MKSIVVGASKTSHNPKFVGGKKDQDDDSSDSEYEEQDDEAKDNDPHLMDSEERQEWRRKIREVINKYPDVEEEIDLDERRKKMQKLLADYPLVVEEDDPDWPDDADGRGFNLDQFFNKITIKNVRKEDDENYDSENEIVWQDDNYIRPIKDITTAEWEEAVFKDISPLIVLVHNRYKRLVFGSHCSSFHNSVACKSIHVRPSKLFKRCHIFSFRMGNHCHFLFLLFERVHDAHFFKIFSLLEA